MGSEDIIESLGPFGYWQRVIFFSLCLPDVFVAFSILLPVFTGAPPPRECNEAPHVQNDTSVTVITDHSNNSEIRNMTCTCEEQVFVGDFTSIVSEWSLVCSKGYVSDLITSIQMSGLLLGAAVFGQLSDLYGRKKMYFFTVGLLCISAFVSSFSINWQMYAGFRFFVGVSAGGYFCINCVYPLEFVGRRWRTLCGTLGYWAIGEMLLALFAYFIRGWRHLTMASSLCGVVFFALWWLIPESPRWLAANHHTDAACKVYLNIAKKNKIPPPDLFTLSAQEAIQEEGKEKMYTYLDLFKTRELIKITLVTVVIWFTVFVTYYETSFNLKHLSGNRYLNMFFAGLLDLAAMISVILFNNVIGRRFSQVLYVGIAAVCNGCILGIYTAAQGDTMATGVKTAALIGKASALAGTYVVQIWSAELYPTQVRNAGVGIGSVACRVGSFISPQIVYLGTYYQIAPYIFIVVLCGLILPLCFLLDETNGKALIDEFNYSQKTKRNDVTNDIADEECCNNSTEMQGLSDRLSKD